MYELKMRATESGKTYAAGIGLGVSQHLVAADRFAIEDSALKAEEEKADLLERRLRRIELALGIHATPESTAALESALSQL